MSSYDPILRAVAADAFDSSFMRRLFHGRGRTFPGLEHINVDWYPPVLFISLFRPVSQQWLDDLVNELWRTRKEAVGSILVQHRQGASTQTQLLKGCEPPVPHVVEEWDTHKLLNVRNIWDTHKFDVGGDSLDILDTHISDVNAKDDLCKTKPAGNHQSLVGNSLEVSAVSLKCHVQLKDSQNVGVFPDMINGRAWVRANSKGKNVLNLFSYTCLFSVAALQGEASGVVNVDMNKAVMAAGQRNHKINGLEKGRAKFFTHNIFNSWGKIRRNGPYDLIIVDPPSFQKGSFVLTKDYQRLLKKLPELASDDAKFLLCLNSPELGCDYLTSLVSEHCGELELIGRLNNHPDFPEVDDDKSLKVLLYQTKGSA